MNRNERVFYGQVIHDHLVMADFNMEEAINTMADKGNTEVAKTVTLMSIAECLMAIGTMMYEKREGERK